MIMDYLTHFSLLLVILHVNECLHAIYCNPEITYSAVLIVCRHQQGPCNKIGQRPSHISTLFQCESHRWLFGVSVQTVCLHRGQLFVRGQVNWPLARGATKHLRKHACLLLNRQTDR